MEIKLKIKMKYCPKCGSQVKNNTKFCQKCGAKILNNQLNQNGLYCSYCGFNIPNDAIKCLNCNKYLDAEANDEHIIAIVIGYIFSFLVPLAAIVVGFYLVTQKNEDVHKHGLIMFIIAIVMMFITYLIFAKLL